MAFDYNQFDGRFGSGGSIDFRKRGGAATAELGFERFSTTAHRWTPAELGVVNCDDVLSRIHEARGQVVADFPNRNVRIQCQPTGDFETDKFSFALLGILVSNSVISSVNLSAIFFYWFYL